MWKRFLLILFLLYILFSTDVSAHHDEKDTLPPWPLQEEIEHLGIPLAYSLEKSEKEINVVTTFQRSKSTDRMSRDLNMRVEFDYGLSHRLTVGLEFLYTRLNPDDHPENSGSGEVEVEGKYSFLSNLWLDAAIGMAVGSRFQENPEDGDKELLVELFLPLSHEFSRRVRSHVNLGVEWIGMRKPERLVQAAIEYRPLTSALILQTALNLEFEESETVETSIVGGFLLPFNRLNLGVGFPIGLSENASNWGVSFNLEFEFENDR